MIKKGVYTYFFLDSKIEDKFTKSIVDVTVDFDIDEVVKKIIELPMNEQIHVLHNFLDSYYDLVNSDSLNRKLEKLLKRKEFKQHYSLLKTIIYSEDTLDSKFKLKMSKFEKKLGVKIEFE
jgi:hypothetical protein